MQSFVIDSIVDKLLKEKCTLYQIVGEDGLKGVQTNNKIVTYTASLDDEYIQYIIKSIMPDAIIFTGAFDERYFWSDYHRCSSKYMSELTNIIVTAADLEIKKFIYLSSLNVYGFDSSGVVTEETPVAPSNMKSIIVAQGETICENMSESGKINAITLRFGTIYGSTRLDNIQSDYIVNKCYKALVEKKIVVNNQVMPIISVQDVAIAVYKAIYLDAESGVYNVCDNATISDADISDIIIKAYAGLDIEKEEDNKFKRQDYTIDGSKFNSMYSFFQKTNYEEGILATTKFVKENISRFGRSSNRRRGDSDRENLWFYLKFLGEKLLPYVENIIVFCLFSFFKYFLSDNQFLSSIDIMVLYIIIVSVAFGKQQAVISVLFTLFYTLFDSRDKYDTLITLLVNYGFLTKIMFYFIIGMIVGHTRDMLRQRIVTNEDRIEYLESEYAKLNEINDVTVMVKQALEERLLSQGDSLARVYAIIGQIDGFMPPKAYIASIEVLSELLKSEHISIYTRSSKDKIFDLEYYSSEYAKTLGKQVNMLDYPDILICLNNNVIFNNKELKKGFPLLASAVRREGVIESVVMVWDIEFEGLTLYHINLFITMTKIINRAVIKSLDYRDSLDEMYKLRYNYDMYKLRASHDIKNLHFTDEREFSELLSTSEECKKKYHVPYHVMEFQYENTDLNEIIEEVKSKHERSIYINIVGNIVKVLLLNLDEDTKELLDNTKKLSGAVPAAAESVEAVHNTAESSEAVPDTGAAAEFF